MINLAVPGFFRAMISCGGSAGEAPPASVAA